MVSENLFNCLSFSTGCEAIVAYQNYYRWINARITYFPLIQGVGFISLTAMAPLVSHLCILEKKLTKQGLQAFGFGKVFGMNASNDFKLSAGAYWLLPPCLTQHPCFILVEYYPLVVGWHCWDTIMDTRIWTCATELNIFFLWNYQSYSSHFLHLLLSLPRSSELKPGFPFLPDTFPWNEMYPLNRLKGPIK